MYFCFVLDWIWLDWSGLCYIIAVLLCILWYHTNSFEMLSCRFYFFVNMLYLNNILYCIIRILHWMSFISYVLFFLAFRRTEGVHDSKHSNNFLLFISPAAKKILCYVSFAFTICIIFIRCWENIMFSYR